MKMPTILDQTTETSLRRTIRSLDHKALEERFLAVLEAAKYVYVTKSTDEIEYRSFLAGLEHAIKITKTTLESEVV